MRARVAAVPAGLAQDGEAVARVEVGLGLAQRRAIELAPGQADRRAEPPGQRFGRESRAVGIDVEQAAALDQVRVPGLRRQRLVQRRRVVEQGAKRARGLQHPLLAAAREQEAREPRRRARQPRGPDRQRAERVAEEAGQTAPQPGQRRRHDAVGAEPAGVAEARRPLAARLRGVEDGHLEAAPQRLQRAARAGDPRADDGEPGGGAQRLCSPGSAGARSDTCAETTRQPRPRSRAMILVSRPAAPVPTRSYSRWVQAKSRPKAAMWTRR